MPAPPRAFAAPDGAVWEARLLASGRPSPYLAPRLARPLVEFRRVAPPAAGAIYAPLRGGDLAALAPEALVALWSRARSA